MASQRFGARRDDPQPRHPRGHRAWKRDRLLRVEERGSIRNAGRDLAWRLLHAQRRATKWWGRPLRPRPRHDDPGRVPPRQGKVLPLDGIETPDFTWFAGRLLSPGLLVQANTDGRQITTC